MRILLRFLIYIILLCGCFCGFAYFILVTPQGLQAAVDIASMFVPGKIKIETLKGKLNSTIYAENISYINNKTNITAKSLQISWNIWQLIKKENMITHFHINDMKIHAGEIENKSANITGKIELNRGNGLLIIDNLNMSVANADIQISGKYQHIWNLQWQVNVPEITAFVPEVSGSTKTKGTITGTLANPDFNGELEAKNIAIANVIIPVISGKINSDTNNHSLITHLTAQNLQVNKLDKLIPKLSITLNEVHLKSVYRPQQIINFDGDIIIRNNKSLFVGNIDPFKSGTPFQVKVSGENIPLINLPEYKINISPNLELTYAQQQFNVKGSVHIPDANVTPRDLTRITTLPSEVVFVEQKEQQTNLATNLNLNVQISLGKKVHLTYQNLNSFLEGSVVINQTSGKLLSATGELHTNKGEYSAYGKLLKIQDGHLIYNGSLLTNPGLDIRAIYEVKTIAVTHDDSKFINDNKLKSAYTGSDKVIVGVLVKGLLNNPKITLFSDPAGMTQTDIISYLLFNRPAGQVKAANSLTLLNAVVLNSQGQSGGTIMNLPKQIEEKLGLSELGVGSTSYYDPTKNTSADATTFNVGKQFGKRFSVHYSIGIFDPISILSLRYQIIKGLSIQSETSSVDTGADLVYEFERG